MEKVKDKVLLVATLYALLSLLVLIRSRVDPYLRRLSDAITRGFYEYKHGSELFHSLVYSCHDVPNGFILTDKYSWLEMRRAINVIHRHVPDLQ